METEAKLLELLRIKQGEVNPADDLFDNISLLINVLGTENYNYGHAAALLSSTLSPRQKTIKDAHELLNLPYP